MICGQCQEDRPRGDFYQSHICYKCTFKNKTLLLKTTKQRKHCKICKNVIPEENLIFWKACYCSDSCKKVGKDLHNKNYWIRVCNAPKNPRGLQYGKPK